MLEFIFRKVAEVKSLTWWTCAACSQFLPLLCNAIAFFISYETFWFDLFRWWHREMTSDCLFNNISSRSSTISNFSCKYKLHLLELGLYDLYLPFILQGIGGWSFLTASFQYSVGNFASFFFSALKDFLWFGLHFLKAVSQIPFYNLGLYFLPSQLSLAWYKVFLVRQAPRIGQFSFFKHLHNFVFCWRCVFEYFFIMSVTFKFQVWHAGVTELESVFIKDFAKSVARWKTFVEKSKKLFTDVRL